MFPARLEEVPRVVSFILGRARRLIPEEKAARLELAVEEWLVNVCHHAYSDRGGPLEVAVSVGAEQVVVEISDEGRSFDPTTTPVPDVTRPLAEREPGGLGLLLITRMLDDVRYRRGGDRNVVTFTISR